MTWASDLTKGIKEILEPKKNNYIFHIENMDTKRYSSKEYYQSLANLYKTKYHDTNFDLIITSDNNAFDFIKEYRDSIFGNTPVVFCGVNDFKDSMLDGFKNFTGIAETPSEVETVELLLKLHPEVKNLFIINDYLKTGRAWKETLDTNLARFKNKLNIIHNENLTFEELQELVKKLPSDTAILMGVYFADKEGNYITYEKAGELLLDISPVPVYCLTNFSISNGVIGGKVITGIKHGNVAAKIGLSILQGMKPENIEIVKEGTNEFIFNKKALDKFNIDVAQLPKESIIINHEESLYEKYGMMTSLILIICVVITSLLVLIYYRKELSNEKGVIKLLIYAPMIFIPTVIAILIFVILDNNRKVLMENIETLKTQHISIQKQKVRNKVEELSEYIYSSPLSKEKILNNLTTMQNNSSNYFFILDTKGLVLLHPDEKLLGTSIIGFKDIKGNTYIKKAIQLAIRNSIDFVEYQWENPKTKTVDTKYTYVKYIPKHDIIIASGVYDQELKKLVKQKIAELYKSNDTQIEQILIISFVVLILSLVLSFFLSDIIKKAFIKYDKEIDEKNKNLESINQNLETKINKEVENNREKDRLIFQQSKMVSMGEMIGNIAHQWRQPLSIISTSATGVIMQKKFGVLKENELIKTCETINQNAQYLSQTIDDFKNYIKNDRQKTLFNLKENFDNLFSLLSGTIKNNDITVVSDIDPHLQIEGYPNELIQCTMNIINNAKDALKQYQEDTRYIFVEVQKKQDTIWIKIKDNGGGIKDNIINKIFEPYFTTKHQFHGTGLGLSMTYNMITEGMNGTIEVHNTTYTYENKEYIGAEFIITLPL